MRTRALFWAGLPALWLLFWSPAAHSQCQSDRDCKAGRACKGATCVSLICTKDTDCAGADVCEASICKAAPQTPQSQPAPGQSLPAAGATPQQESITGLWVAGTITASVVYLTTFVLGTALSEPSVRGQAMGYLLVPVFGPFILNGSNIANTQYTGVEIASGLIQAAGIGMIVAGLVLHRPVTPSYSLGDAPDSLKLSLGPSLRGQGVLLSLAF